MNNQVALGIIVTVRCPECLNTMRVKYGEAGSYSGTCTKCKSHVSSKQRNARERHIKIVRLSAN